MLKRTGLVLLKFGLTTLALTLFVQITALSQAVKPQISAIDNSTLPRGCSYSLDDWKGNTLAWAPYQASPESGGILMSIDGERKEIPINSRSDEAISAYDGQYYVEVQTPIWKEIGSELRTAKAVLAVKNTRSYTETKLVVRASQGC
jgi:hypothetical protein